MNRLSSLNSNFDFFYTKSVIVVPACAVHLRTTVYCIGRKLKQSSDETDHLMGADRLLVKRTLPGFQRKIRVEPKKTCSSKESF
jgi:hypothetical protein